MEDTHTPCGRALMTACYTIVHDCISKAHINTTAPTGGKTIIHKAPTGGKPIIHKAPTRSQHLQPCNAPSAASSLARASQATPVA